MTMRPLHDRVLIKRTKEDEKTPGGIIIPQTAGDQEPAFKANVIAVGNGKVLDDGTVQPLDVKPGDVVLVARYHGAEVKIDGETHIVCRADDILGTVEDA